MDEKMWQNNRQIIGLISLILGIFCLLYANYLEPRMEQSDFPSLDAIISTFLVISAVVKINMVYGKNHRPINFASIAMFIIAFSWAGLTRDNETVVLQMNGLLIGITLVLIWPFIDLVDLVYSKTD